MTSWPLAAMAAVVFTDGVPVRRRLGEEGESAWAVDLTSDGRN
jgi:hypothetical protein